MEDHRGSGCVNAGDEVFVYVDYKAYIELEARYENLKRDIYSLLESAVDNQILSVRQLNHYEAKWELHKHD